MIETKTFSTSAPAETAVLVAVHTGGASAALQAEEYLDELAFLALTSGVNTRKTFLQKLDRPDHRTYVGKGKLEEIVAYVQAYAVDMVIFDDDLSPSQVRNLEAALDCKILDRSLLILNIFSQRAQTAQAKTQVELAQYQYLYPRLTRLWTHLSKQRGGVGMRGPGEKELETDRRIVQDRIALLKEKLSHIDRQRITQRKNRARMVRVAIVGYTNVGKSTLMNLLTKSDVFAEDKLFATVDATVRKVAWEGIPFLLTDTVGFIRKLPTHLIESFKSTLDEVRESDVLLHVVDVAHPAFEEHISVVNGILADIGAADKPTLLVFNKIDDYRPDPDAVWEETGQSPAEQALAQLEHSYLNAAAPAPGVRGHIEVVFVSARERSNIETLRQKLLGLVRTQHVRIFPNYLAPTTSSALNGHAHA